MKSTRLFKYLKTLNTKEWKLLKSHIDITIPTKSDTHILFQHIYQQKNNLNHPNLDLTYIQEKILKRRTRKAVLNTSSLITETVKEILIKGELDNDPFAKKQLLLKALYKKGAKNLSDKLYDQTINQLDDANLTFWNSLNKQLLIHHHYFSLTGHNRSKTHLQLQEAIHSVELYHQQLRALYKFECVHSIVTLNKKNYAQIIDDYEIIENHSDELINIFYHLKNIATQSDEQSAVYLETILRTKKMSQAIQLTIYIVLRIYYASKINKGFLKLTKELFELQKFMIDGGYLFYNNSISAVGFLSIINLSTFTKQAIWANEFLRKHLQLVNSIDRPVVESISMSLILFSEQKYDECLTLINQTYAKKTVLKSILNRLELITYIELYGDDKIFLKHRLDNFRLFYVRNKKILSERSQRGSKNLHTILTMIVNGEDKEKIRNKILSMEFIFYRVYVFQKLEL